MTILDANILIYGYNLDAPEHRSARVWLEALFAGPETIGIPWLTLWAFLRISTNARAMRQPLIAGEAFEVIRELLAQQKVAVVEPGSRHAHILQAVISENRISGAMTTDAVLASLALENGATLASTDRGFARFKGLRWVNPLEA
jgi:hypothetical protein